MSNFPLCSTCEHGIVQQRKVETGVQDPKRIAFCTLMKVEVPSDLSLCSQHAAPGKQISYWDMRPEPQILRTNNVTKKAVADVLLIMLQARMRP